MLWPPRGFYWVDDRFVAQAYLFIGLSLMGLWIYSRPFSMQRLKAWWAGKPEPRFPAASTAAPASAASPSR
jgi:hypothetical protein